ncbi:MAG: hypothetical protein JF599_12185 [Verrucomicrobia bacterium]|nr:hypothetical protein [Verrucomicrobiota bacterium]
MLGSRYTGMGVKIKSNDDRIKAAAIAVLLLSRDQLARGRSGGLIAAALDAYRNDYAGYKTAHPKRDLAAAKDLSVFKNARQRADYERLIAAVEGLLARIERNRTQFSSLVELDNFLAFNLKTLGL